jgi:glutamine synthetase type III
MNYSRTLSSEMPEDLNNYLKIFESKNNIKIFKKYNNISILRDINKIKDKCIKIKKKIVMELSNDLKNLCVNNIDIDINKIKEIQQKNNNNIQEIDNLMNIINDHDFFKQEDIFIEVYSN